MRHGNAILGEITYNDVEKVSEQLLTLINKRALILLNQEGSELCSL